MRLSWSASGRAARDGRTSGVHPFETSVPEARRTPAQRRTQGYHRRHMPEPKRPPRGGTRRGHALVPPLRLTAGCRRTRSVLICRGSGCLDASGPPGWLSEPGGPRASVECTRPSSSRLGTPNDQSDSGPNTGIAADLRREKPPNGGEVEYLQMSNQVADRSLHPGPRHHCRLLRRSQSLRLSRDRPPCRKMTSFQACTR